MRFHILTLSLVAGLLAGCAVEQEDGAILPLDRRLPLSTQTMYALGGVEVARLLLGPDTRHLAVERMRLNGERRYGPAWVTFPDRHARPVVDGPLYEGLCAVSLRTLVMDENGRGVRDIKRVDGRVVLGDVREIARSDPDFGRRLVASRAACADWSRLHPKAWFLDAEFAPRLTSVAQGLAELPAGIAEGRIGCADTCRELLAVITDDDLTATSGCDLLPEDGENALCVTAVFDEDAGPYAWEEVHMAGPIPAPGRPFRPTRARVESQVLSIN